MTIVIPQCLHCARFNNDDDNNTCQAFPLGIPDAIWSGRVDHSRASFPGDNGLLYLRDKKAL